MKKITIEIKWALIFAAMTLVCLVLEKLAGFHSTHIDKHHIVTNFIAIPAIAVYVFAFLDKRKKYYGGTMTYMQGFMCGVIITLFVTILSPLTQSIVSYVITPEYFPNAIKLAVSTGAMTQQDAENYFNNSNYVMMGLMGAPVMGLITTAVVAIFTRKKATLQNAV